MLPPIPSWDGLHPLIIHFPIALLLLAPLVLLAGLLLPRHERALAVSAFWLMLLGTVAAWFAVATGEAAGQLAERARNLLSVVERHAVLAHATRSLFTVLTVLFGALLFAPALLRRPLARRVTVSLDVVFLVLYAGGSLMLVQTADQGGRLVHEYGVRASVAAARAPAAELPGMPVFKPGRPTPLAAKARPAPPEEPPHFRIPATPPAHSPQR